MKSKINVGFGDGNFGYQRFYEIEVDTSSLSFDIKKVILLPGTLYQEIIELVCTKKHNNYVINLTLTKTYDDDGEITWEVHMQDFKTKELLSYTLSKDFQNVMEEILKKSLEITNKVQTQQKEFEI